MEPIQAQCDDRCFTEAEPSPVYQPGPDGRGDPDLLIGVILPEVGGQKKEVERRRESCVRCLCDLASQKVIRLNYSCPKE
jgi:hypothetical protein